MAKGYVGIPTSYTPVEYIESSGTQYIDTGFKANNNTRVMFDFSPTSVTSSWGWVFGGRNAYHDADYAIAFKTSTWYSGFGTTDLQPNATITANTEYLIDKNKNVTTINGTSYTNSVATFQSDYNLLLLGVSDGPTIQHCNAKLYSCKVYDNETLIRDFIPAIDQDNVACLYEQVEGKFYYNNGTGSFAVGSATGSSVSVGNKARKITKAYVGIPTSYTPVEYIKSSGTQYIDTGFKHNQNTRIVAKFEIDDYRAWAFLFGSYGGANAYPRRLLGVDVNNSGKFGSYYGYSYETFNINALGIHEFDFNKNIHTIDNETKTYSTQTFQSQFNDLIFGATNYTGKISISTDSLKLYYFKIYDNDVLVRDFVPVVDENNVACLYEQVEEKLYYNKGTGSFTAGSTTGQTVSLGNRARKIKKGYVGVNGVARLIFSAYTPVMDRGDELGRKI